MWEIFSSFHSRESGNLPVFAAFGGEFAPLALESGDSRFRGNGGWFFCYFFCFLPYSRFLFPPPLPLFVSFPASAFCFLPRSRFLFPLLLPLFVSFPAPAFCPLSCFRFSAPISALPPLLPLPPPSPFPRKRESPVNWGGAGNARTAPLILCRRVFAVQQRDRPCRIFWRFGRIAAATPTAN